MPATQTLRRGARGAAVRGLQERLNELGFDSGKVDGVFGPSTERALRQFQDAKGLQSDGIAGPNTWRALDASQEDTPSPTGAEPPEHIVVDTEQQRVQVALRDVNFQDEELGYWELVMEVAKTGTGQVYPLRVYYDTHIHHPATNCVSSGADITSFSVNNGGERYAEILFKVTVGGPSVVKQEDLGLGVQVGWKSEAKGVEANGQASWTHGRASTTGTSAEWKRLYRIVSTPTGFAWAEMEAKDIVGEPPQLVIDDDDCALEDRWGVDADWWLATYTKKGL